MLFFFRLVKRVFDKSGKQLVKLDTPLVVLHKIWVQTNCVPESPTCLPRPEKHKSCSFMFFDFQIAAPGDPQLLYIKLNKPMWGTDFPSLLRFAL